MSCISKGIDVSYAQGIINWDKLKGKIDFAIIRAGYGQNNIDKQFVRNISECNRLGIPCGVYWYSYAYTPAMAAQEAAYCLTAIKPYKLNMPVCFDFEYDSVAYTKGKGVNVTKALATSLVTAFCTAIEQGGHWAANYANADYLSRYFDTSLLARFDLWDAGYYTSYNLNNPPHTCGMWQYSSSGKFNGINGNVDCNVTYKDYKSLIK